MDSRILNLRKKCIKDLSEEKFNQIYKYLNNNTDSLDHTGFVNEMERLDIRQELCFKVEELVYLESEVKRLDKS